jgi:hypothetical protein
MAKAKGHDKRPIRPHRGDDHSKDNRREPYDDPKEHLEIERGRFQGGLPPTPELYARAREQWYRLPGSVVRPSMDPVIGDPSSGTDNPPEQGQPGGKRVGR